MNINELVVTTIKLPNNFASRFISDLRSHVVRGPSVDHVDLQDMVFFVSF
jgi:hypothetical protein